MSDGKIYITISDERGTERIKDTSRTVSTGKKQKEESNQLADFAKHQFFNLIEREAKQMVNYTLENIGNFTGDYNAQRDVNYALSAIGVLSSIGLGAYHGAKVGGPIGALIGAATVATAQVVNFGLQLKSQNIETRKQNYSIEQMRQLSGLDTLTNGSRI